MIETADRSGSGETAIPRTAPRPRIGSETWRRFVGNRGASVGLAIVILYVGTAALADVLVPYNPTQGNLRELLQGPSASHWLGADELGRDILSRLIVGARVSLQIQVLAALFAMLVGVLWGLVAGYLGGWVDDLSMRLIDIQLAFPSILLAIAIVAVLGTGLTNVILAVGIASVPQFARLVRGVVLGLREMEFIEAARSTGESHMAIMFRYVLPGTIAPVIIMGTLRMATVLLAAASLSFLGLGVQPPSPEWGAMLSSARDYMFQSPHVTTAPGLAITAVVLGFNLVGDGLRDALDPRMRV